MTQAGQTMVETMLVLGLLATVALLTADAFLPAASRNRLLAIRTEVAAELRMARHLAMTEGRSMAVRVEAEGRRLVVAAGVGPDRPVVRRLDLSGKGVVVDGFSNGTAIVFYPSGRTATPSTVMIKSTRDQAVSSLTVSITGRVALK